ncbi:LptF/LptG family permease [candidate division WOR-3 bacterium]|nr:LptF/LptG family permease [candidate division WOR-3 bacterium]
MGNRILERYILKRFIRAFLLTLIAFLFIYIITNLFEHIGYFIDRKANTLEIIGYYLLFSPEIVVRLMPLSILLGVYFSLGILTRHNEVLAIRGLGISPLEILKPIFIYGFLISIVVLAFNLSFVPRTGHLLKEFKRTRLDKVKGTRKAYGRNINYITEEGWIVKINTLRGEKISDVNLFQYQKGRMVFRIYAKRGEWKDIFWLLEDVHKRTFNEEGSLTYEFKESEKSDIIKVTPAELAKSTLNPLNLSFTELLRYAERLELSGQLSQRERVELYGRISYPLMGFIILFFGCPLALEMKRRGLIFGFGLGILASFTFWGIIQLFKELGIKGALPPYLSVIIPDLLFLSLGFYLLLKSKPL